MLIVFIDKYVRCFFWARLVFIGEDSVERGR